jgi:hypothetical protein
MAFCRVTTSLIIEEGDALEIEEALLTFIDSLIIRNLSVFESDVICQRLIQIPNFEELRLDMPNME